MKAKYIGLMLLAGVTLAGCGGSSSSSTATPTSSASKVAITSQNQATITNAAVGAAKQNLTQGYLAAVGGVQTTTSSSNDRELSNWADFAFNQIAKQQNMPAGVIGAVTSYNCGATAASGTYTVDTDNATYLTFTFNNCILGSSTSNGTLSLSGLVITKNASSVVTSITATFSFNLTTVTTTNGVSVTSKLAGGFNIGATGIGSATRTDSITGTSLVSSVGTQYNALTNFGFTSAYNNTVIPAQSYSNNINFSYASDTINAAFDFKTTAALVINAGDVYPRSGQVVISGANSTALRLTILAGTGAGTSSGPVTLEFSTDGGVSWGNATQYTWATL